MSAAADQLLDLSAALQQVRAGTLGPSALAHIAQEPQTLLAALPERYAGVLQQLLNGLESSALFSEESCSFSQKDLLDNLQLWLDKAQLQLDKGPLP